MLCAANTKIALQGSGCHSRQINLTLLQKIDPLPTTYTVRIWNTGLKLSQQEANHTLLKIDILLYTAKNRSFTSSLHCKKITDYRAQAVTAGRSTHTVINTVFTAILLVHYQKLPYRRIQLS